MKDFSALQNAVQRNCHISDSRYAQHYGLCAYLLKMRELYRWEQGLPYSASIAQEKIGAWLDAREALWDSLENATFSDIPLGDDYAPFASAEINAALLEHGLVYSSGYGRFAKPLFFLAELDEHRQTHGLEIFICGHELARDLVAPPALSRDGQIFIRRESIQRMIWERFEEWHWQQRHNLLDFLPGDTIESMLSYLTDVVSDSLIAHEQGEVEIDRILGHAWKDLLMSVANSKAELMLRAIRDHWADCRVTLPHLLAQDNPAALAFYLLDLTGMRKALFPALVKAGEDWQTTHDTLALCEVVKRGEQHWQHVAHNFINACSEQKKPLNTWIEAQFCAIVLA
jgi:hypothetical protein